MTSTVDIPPNQSIWKHTQSKDGENTLSIWSPKKLLPLQWSSTKHESNVSLTR